MRKISRLPCCLLLACVWPLQAQQTSVKDTVLDNERKFSELQIQRKCEEAAQLLADDFQGTSGAADSKSDFLNACRTGELITISEKFSSVEFRPLTTNTAIVAYLDDGDFIWDGRLVTAHMRVSSVWVKHGPKWLLHLHTSTSIPFAVSEKGKLQLVYLDSAEQYDESASQKEIENQIIALERRLWEGDATQASKLESEDYEAIKHAHRYHRADDEAAAKDVKFALLSMDDIRVRMLRPDVALITYHVSQKGSFRGTEVPPSLYFGSIWVNRGGQWKNVFLEENAPDVFTDIYKPSSQF